MRRQSSAARRGSIMADLAKMTCKPAKSGAEHVTHEEVTEYLLTLPGWQVTKEEEINKLRKTYFFKKYPDAVSFVDRVAEEAEEQQHHPVIVLEWGRVTVTWWTHVLEGLHINDFIMAAKTEK